MTKQAGRAGRLQMHLGICSHPQSQGRGLRIEVLSPTVLITGGETDFFPPTPIRSQRKNCLITMIFGLLILHELQECLNSLLHSDSPCSSSDSYHLFLEYHNTIFPVSALPSPNLFYTLQTNLPMTILLKSITPLHHI